jgi:ribosomal protein S18 acetylase RimI-like enzyme
MAEVDASNPDAPMTGTVTGGAPEEGEKLSFRMATQDDVAAVVALIESAYRGDESRLGWTTEADLVDGQRTDLDEVSALVASPSRRMLLISQGGDLVGCCLLEREPSGTVYLGMLSVRPRLQAKGLGKALMAAAEDFTTRVWGARDIRMRVISRRSELIDWYARRGYLPIGEPVPFPNDRPGDFAKVPDLEFVILTKVLQTTPASPPAPQ